MTARRVFCIYNSIDLHLDEPKRLANLAKNGLDFAALEEGFLAEVVIVSASKGRSKVLGSFNGLLVAVVIFAALGAEAVSIISFRPANTKERNLL